MAKATVTLGGFPLAANSGVVWRFTTGVQPYQTVFSTHSSVWAKLQKKMGEPLTLDITDARGTKTSIQQVTILHVAPNDSPNRVSFVVSDRRWKWPYKLVARDYNIPRRTGERTATKQEVPILNPIVDAYDYLDYSLRSNGSLKWLPREIIEDVLTEIEGSQNFRVDSFPIEGNGSARAGEFSVQNVSLRDAGDVALGRAMAYVPGLQVYVDADGMVVLFDGADLQAADDRAKTLIPFATWSGDALAKVDRKKIRPKKVVVHYHREVEVVFDFQDDYSGGTVVSPDADAPYLENVIPTVDPSTQIDEYDPVARKSVVKNVPPGTWVRVDKWLEAMDADRPDGSLPWTFETIKVYWLFGLDGVLGGSLTRDEKIEANYLGRIEALKQHFRQTFRINRRFMSRVRTLLAKRAGLLDPVSGARASAAVWGQATIIPTDMGSAFMGTRISSASIDSRWNWFVLFGAAWMMVIITLSFIVSFSQ